MIRLKRVYEAAEAADGMRVLVDRLWPRGLGKDDLACDLWLKEVAPSAALRRWFGHDPSRWQAFQERYQAELAARPESWQPLLAAARTGTVTLLYSARDEAHNNAVALKAFLEERLREEDQAGA